MTAPLPADEPALDHDTAAEDAASGVVVRLGGARYALPMAAVAEVGRVPRITRVPGVPAWVAGVSNWRGRVLPVVDLRPLLGGPTSVIGDRGRVLVAGDDTISVGVLVEGVEGVVVPDRELDPPPATVGADAAELLAGQWSDTDGPIGMIDVAALLRLRERLASARRGD